MPATETEWLDDGNRIRIFGRSDGTWDVVEMTMRNESIVSRRMIDCGLTHEMALRIAGRIRNEIRTSA